MCGICGLYGPAVGPPHAALVDAMRASIRHRGPDQGSTDAAGQAVLGHQRLCVVDLETGEQPVASESGDVVAVFNGELYDFPELRAALRGHEVRGTGDTPVIPHLYEEHGPAFVERLEGMFALALVDTRRDRLVLARDRLGKKPLVWTRLPDGTLAFASELKALLTLPGLPREVDLEAVEAYLALGYVPGDRTGLVGVRRLPPGHVLVAEDGAERVERYWEPRPAQVTGCHEERDWLELVRAEVGAAVARRLVADVPLGALLSGGIDSSVVVALMAEASRGPVRTFTVGFPDARYDERAYARAVADRYATEHVDLEVDADVAETVERLSLAFDEPLGDEAAFPTFLVCEAARSRVTVALTGDGGDESFAGYERYAAFALAERVPAAAAGAGARVLRALPQARREPRSPLFRAARFLDAAATPAGGRYARLTEVFPARLRAELLGRAPSFRPRPPDGPGVGALQRLDLETYLPGDLLPKADVASMAHSLELRSPLLDRRVVELGLALPDGLKVRGREGKRALRLAFADLLPPAVAGRRKTGFGVPLGRWFREDLRELARDVLPGAGRAWLREDVVRRLLDEHASGRADHGQRLWCLLMLELWLRTHVERPAPVAAHA